MECILSGNDLIMPGSEEDIRLLTDAVQKGTLSIDAIKQCAARVVRLMADSRR